MNMRHVARRRPSFWRILTIVAVALVVLLGLTVYFISRSLPSESDLAHGVVDLTRVADGQYEGAFSTIPVRASVRVTVVDHRITDITLLSHRNGQGKPGEAVIERVLTNQTLAVDTVTGATISSNVILKAIEAALNKGLK